MKRTDEKRRKRAARARRRRRNILRTVFLLLFLLIFLLILLTVRQITGKRYTEQTGDWIDVVRPDIDVELLTVNPYSRPGIETERITGIVVHYTANPGATAMENRNYFENLKTTGETKASSNFIVGLEGEIIQCVPTWEVAYASNDRNKDTVSVECCHPDESGKFTDDTYDSAVELCAWLCLKFDLDASDIIRHYDVTGKNCPKYYVENEAAWEQFREDVGTKRNTYLEQGKS